MFFQFEIIINDEYLCYGYMVIIIFFSFNVGTDFRRPKTSKDVQRRPKTLKKLKES